MLDKGKQNNTEILCDINKQDTAEVFRQRYEKYRLLVENATVPMVHYAPDGRFLFMNTFAVRNLGSQPEAFVGMSLYDMFPRMADKIQKRNRIMMKTGAAQKYEDDVELPTGTRWFSSVATPLSGENGKVFAFQVISLDITRLKRNGNGSSYSADH